MPKKDLETTRKNCLKVAALLKTIAHPQRLMLLCYLNDGEKTVSDLEGFCGASQSMVSQHLNRMKLEGVVNSRRDGNFVYYRIEDVRVLALMENLEKIFCNAKNDRGGEL